MNFRFLVSSLAVGVASLLNGFVVHAVLLGGDYARLPALFRSEAEAGKYFPFMLLAHLSVGFGVTWLYRRQPAPTVLGPGVAFGLGVAVALAIPMYLFYYAVQPMPGTLVAKQVVFNAAGAMLLGLLTAWLNRTRNPNPVHPSRR
jgi:hypothetical protein